MTEEICECGYPEKYHTKEHKEKRRKSLVEMKVCKKFKPKNHSPKDSAENKFEDKPSVMKGAEGTSNSKGCGKLIESGYNPDIEEEYFIFCGDEELCPSCQKEKN